MSWAVGQRLVYCIVTIGTYLPVENFVMDTANLTESPFHALERWEPDSCPTTFRADERKPLWGEDGFTFDDVLDTVNPLQHIPLASTKYQEATGDTASEGAKLVGGLLFGVLTGGVLGAVVALANSAVRHETGKDLPEHALALLEGDTPAGLAAQRQQSDELADAPIPDLAVRVSKDPSVDTRASRPVNYFVDDELARSLHPGERLLAVGSYSPGVAKTGDIEAGQAGEMTPDVSMKKAVTEAYRVLDAEQSGDFWWEV